MHTIQAPRLDRSRRFRLRNAATTWALGSRSRNRLLAFEARVFNLRPKANPGTADLENMFAAMLVRGALVTGDKRALA